MKPNFIKTGKITLEIVGVMLAVLIICVGYLLWRVEQGAVRLNVFLPSIERSINNTLPDGYVAGLSDVLLATDDEEPSSYQLIISNLAISIQDTDAPDSVSSQASPLVKNINVPQVRVRIPKISLLRLNPAFSDIVIRDLVVEIEDKTRIDQDRTQPAIVSKVDEKPSSSSKDKSSHFLEDIITSKRFRDQLKSVTVRNTQINYTQANGVSSNQADWVAHEGNFLLTKNVGSSFDIKASSQFKSAQKISPFTFNVRYDEETQIATLDAKGDNFPVGDFLSLVSTVPGDKFTAPVSGSAIISTKLSGQIIDADFNLVAGYGDLLIKDQTLPIHALSFKGNVGPSKKGVTVERFVFDIGDSKGTMAGLVGLRTVAQQSNQKSQQKGQSAREIFFDVDGQDIQIDSQGFFSKILPMQNLSLLGSMDIEKRCLTLEAVSIESDGVGVKGDLRFELPKGVNGEKGPSFGLKVNLKSSGKISIKRISALWPTVLTPRDRQWVIDRVRKGYVYNLNFIMDLPVGLKDKIGHIPDENMELKFDIAGVHADFIEKFTPLSDANGRGILKGSSLNIELDKGYLGGVLVENGLVSFPRFFPSGGERIYRFNGKGDAQEMLTILNGDPFHLIRRSGLDPKQIDGQAIVSMEIKGLALKPGEDKHTPRQITYDGKIDFENLSFANVFRTVDLENGKGNIIIKTRDMKISGKGYLGPNLVDIEWFQKFYKEDGPSNFSVSGVFDAALGDELGFATRSFLRGPVDYVIQATGGYTELDTFQINADFTNAQLELKQLGITKVINVPAHGIVEASITDGVANFDKVSLTGGGVDVLGAMRLGEAGQLIDLDFPKLFVKGHADFAMQASRGNNGVLDFNLVGNYLDIGPIINNGLGGVGSKSSDSNLANSKLANKEPLPSSSKPLGFAWGDGVRVGMRLARLGLRNDVVLNQTSLDFFHDAQRLEVFKLAGSDDDNDKIELKLIHKKKEDTGVEHRTIEANAGDLGTLLEGVFGISSVRGGEGILHLDLGTDEGGPILGYSQAQNISIVDAPLLARVFAAGSLDGLNDLLKNQGIKVAQAEADFFVSDGVIHFLKTKAIGPSIGLTAKGEVNLSGQGDISLKGALAPAYQVNSFLGKTPLIGGLFVNREGEGLVALTYKVAGSVGAPSVKINPFSALAPGVLRRAFESGNTNFDKEIYREIQEEKKLNTP